MTAKKTPRKITSRKDSTPKPIFVQAVGERLFIANPTDQNGIITKSGEKISIDPQGIDRSPTPGVRCIEREDGIHIETHDGLKLIYVPTERFFKLEDLEIREKNVQNLEKMMRLASAKYALGEKMWKRGKLFGAIGIILMAGALSLVVSGLLLNSM